MAHPGSTRPRSASTKAQIAVTGFDTEYGIASVSRAHARGRPASQNPPQRSTTAVVMPHR